MVFLHQILIALFFGLVNRLNKDLLEIHEISTAYVWDTGQD